MTNIHNFSLGKIGGFMPDENIMNDSNKLCIRQSKLNKKAEPFWGPASHIAIL